VAALDCARIGLRVVVFATPASVHRPTLFSHRGGIVASLLTELEVDYVVREAGGAPVVGTGSGRDVATQAALGNIVGIPANPFAANVRETLGWRGAWRVYLDRVIPLLTVGTETNLGKIVRRRIGKAATTALVDPVLQELYGRNADQVPVAAVVPGLNQAMTRAGSLTTGIIELLVSDPRAGQVVEVVGGMEHIEAILRERLAFFSARIIAVTDVSLTPIPPVSDVGELPASFDAQAWMLPTAPDAPDVTDVPVASVSGEGSAIPREEISLVAHAVLVNPELVTVQATVQATDSPNTPKGAPNDLFGEVGVTSELPGLESAVPESRAASAAIRRALLSNPHRLPLGPSDLEG
jgi:oxygen-dependent protoporphyrinogen oxidase